MTLLTDAEVYNLFGDPRQHMRSDGTVLPSWESEILVPVELPRSLPLSWDRTTRVNRFMAHRRVAPALTTAFASLFAADGVWETINDFGGCYNFRPVRGKKALSRHAWGIAIDLDVRDNPFMGLVPRVHVRTRQIMAAHGFAWGGAKVWGGDFPWSRRDAMHWEWAGDASALAGA